MSKYKTILLAVGHNPSISNLITGAIDLSRTLAADLHVCHTFPPLDYTYVSALTLGSIYPDSGSFQTDAIKEAEKKLREQISSMGISDEKIHISVGSAADEVSELAKKIDAELIIIGKHDKTRGLLSMIGSTARGIVNQASCDVLTIKAE